MSIKRGQTSHVHQPAIVYQVAVRLGISSSLAAYRDWTRQSSWSKGSQTQLTESETVPAHTVRILQEETSYTTITRVQSLGQSHASSLIGGSVSFSEKKGGGMDREGERGS